MNVKKILLIIALVALGAIFAGFYYYAAFRAEKNIGQELGEPAVNQAGVGPQDAPMPLFGDDYELPEIIGYELMRVEKSIPSSPIDVDMQGYSLVKYKSSSFENVINPYSGEKEKLYQEFYVRFYPKSPDTDLISWISDKKSAVNCRNESLGDNKYLACEELGIVNSSIYYFETRGGVYEFYLGELGLNEDTRQVLESFQIK